MCKRSCGLCPGQTLVTMPCVDLSKRCARYTKAKLCARPNMKEQWCRKSCGSCVTATDPTPGPTIEPTPEPELIGLASMGITNDDKEIKPEEEAFLDMDEPLLDESSEFEFVPVPLLIDAENPLDDKKMEREEVGEEKNDYTLVEDEDNQDGDINGEHEPIEEINEHANKNADRRFIEGDMVRTKGLEAEIEKMKAHAAGYSIGDDASTRASGKWPGNVVPYTISSSITSQGRSAIAAAIADYHKHTCLKFVKRTNQRNYLNIIRGGGCYSYIGRIDRNGQDVSIGRGCEYKGIVIHEFMHALGFYHEQSRRDRDQFIKIDFSNIPTNRANNFQMYQEGRATTHGASYDKQSVMHYSNYAFAIDRSKKVITSLSNPNESLGQRNGFSEIDIQQINAHYGCGSTTTIKTTATPVTSAPITAAPGGPDLGGELCKFFETYREGCKNAIVKLHCEATCNKKAACTAKNIRPDSNCKFWAKRGYCKRSFVDYMKRNCAKSCTCGVEA